MVMEAPRVASPLPAYALPALRLSPANSLENLARPDSVQLVAPVQLDLARLPPRLPQWCLWRDDTYWYNGSWVFFLSRKVRSSPSDSGTNAIQREKLRTEPSTRQGDRRRSSPSGVAHLKVAPLCSRPTEPTPLSKWTRLRRYKQINRGPMKVLTMAARREAEGRWPLPSSSTHASSEATGRFRL